MKHLKSLRLVSKMFIFFFLISYAFTQILIPSKPLYRLSNLAQTSSKSISFNVSPSIKLANDSTIHICLLAPNEFSATLSHIIVNANSDGTYESLRGFPQNDTKVYETFQVTDTLKNKKGYLIVQPLAPIQIKGATVKIDLDYLIEDLPMKKLPVSGKIEIGLCNTSSAKGILYELISNTLVINLKKQ